jgi:hypothetical protein
MRYDRPEFLFYKSGMHGVVEAHWRRAAGGRRSGEHIRRYPLEYAD